jgi:hypothetical protein
LSVWEACSFAVARSHNRIFFLDTARRLLMALISL